MGKEQELPKRSPDQIIGVSSLAKLALAGYVVVPASRSSSDEQAEVVGWRELLVEASIHLEEWPCDDDAGYHTHWTPHPAFPAPPGKGDGQ